MESRKGLRITFSRSRRRRNNNTYETAKSTPKPLGVLDALPKKQQSNDNNQLWRSLPVAKFEKSILPQISTKNTTETTTQLQSFSDTIFKFKSNIERSAVSIPSISNKIETENLVKLDNLAPVKAPSFSNFKRNTSKSPVQDITQKVNPQYDYVPMHSAIRLKPKATFSHLSVPRISVKFKSGDNTPKNSHNSNISLKTQQNLLTTLASSLPKNVTSLTSQAYQTLSIEDRVEVLAQILTTVRRASIDSSTSYAKALEILVGKIQVYDFASYIQKVGVK